MPPGMIADNHDGHPTGIAQESIIFMNENISLTTLTRRQVLTPLVLCTGSVFRIPYSLAMANGQKAFAFWPAFAESKGFEPLKVFRPYFVSSEALSTTQPTLHFISSQLWVSRFVHLATVRINSL